MQKEILKGAILTKEQIQGVIELSHNRSESFGIDREERNNKHFRLSTDELEARREANREILWH